MGGEVDLSECSGRQVAGAVALCVALAACGGEARPAPTTDAEEGSESRYTVVLDSERSDPGQFQLREEEGTVRILTGPAGIAFSDDDAVTSGDFRVAATFLQFGAPVGYREAYGIFVGGRELTGPELEYTYLLVRPTGDYLVKRRLADLTEVIVDWTAHESVETVMTEGDEPRNTLAVEVVSGEARFLVNGEIVHAMPASEARPYGVAGLRANHRLDVRVSDWMLGALTGDP